VRLTTFLNGIQSDCGVAGTAGWPVGGGRPRQPGELAAHPPSRQVNGAWRSKRVHIHQDSILPLRMLCIQWRQSLPVTCGSICVEPAGYNDVEWWVWTKHTVKWTSPCVRQTEYPILHAVHRSRGNLLPRYGCLENLPALSFFLGIFAILSCFYDSWRVWDLFYYVVDGRLILICLSHATLEHSLRKPVATVASLPVNAWCIQTSIVSTDLCWRSLLGCEIPIPVSYLRLFAADKQSTWLCTIIYCSPFYLLPLLLLPERHTACMPTYQWRAASGPQMNRRRKLWLHRAPQMRSTNSVIGFR